MKKNILRMLGVALSLVMVFSLTAAFMPVQQKAEADNDAINIWEEFEVPKQGKNGNWVLATGTMSTDPVVANRGSGIVNLDIGPIVTAIDGTLYCYVGPTGYDNGLADTNYTLFKSTDGGRSWAYIGKVTHTIVAMCTSPVDADVLYYATNDSDANTANDQPGVFKTSNAGGKWYEMLDITQAQGTTNWTTGNNITGPGGTAETITSIDCHVIGDDHVVVVGSKRGTEVDAMYGHVYVFDEGTRITPSWEDQTCRIATTDVDVLLTLLATDFPDSKQIIAVVRTYVAGICNTYVTVKMGASGWDANVANATLQPSNNTARYVSALHASGAFPNDFDSDVDTGNMNLYIGVSDNAWGTGTTSTTLKTYDGGDVYEFIGVKKVDPPDTSTALDLNAGHNITAVIYDGPEGSGTCIAGTTRKPGDDRVIRRSTDGGEFWKDAKKEPTGSGGISGFQDPGLAMTYLCKAIDFADTGHCYAAIGGRDGGVSLRVKDRIYNGIGLQNYRIVHITDLAVAAASPATVFMCTTSNSSQMLMASLSASAFC